MENDLSRHRLIELSALCARYCSALEEAREADRSEFIDTMLHLLPRIYYEFIDIRPAVGVEPDFEGGIPASYVDEDFYESVRRRVESLIGPDDVFLETFEEDMKYSDTPVAASVAECLADIFQPLYNFISVVSDTQGERAEEAYSECHDDFVAYWAQTLCNVLRALNHIYLTSDRNE